MTEDRKRVMSALKTRFVPALRERGFAGSLPYLRRQLPDRVDYLMVQLYSAGGSFVVEVGRTGPAGFTDGPWKHLPIDKINVGHIFYDRRRLTPRDAHGGWRGGDWFEFGPRRYDSSAPAKPQEFYDGIAEQALAIFSPRASPGSRGPSRSIPVRLVRSLMARLPGRSATGPSPDSRLFSLEPPEPADCLRGRRARAAALPLGDLAEDR